MSKIRNIGLSVVIPVYNAEAWIKPTVEHIIAALSGSQFDAEIIIVDDGSTDESAKNAEQLKTPKEVDLQVIRQENRGRYLARKHGVEKAKYENILFIDSRVFIDKGALTFLHDQLKNDSDQIWNGHVNIDKKGNIFARFWDAIVCIAWRKYFRHPKTTSYGLKEFDFYPKGTGFFYVPKKRLVAAMEYFESQTNDLKHSSDDTLLIRFLIKEKDIHLSPEFACLYHSRSTFQGFLKHAYNRGQFFIDGFLRPGNRFFIPLLLVLALSVCLVMSLFLMPTTTLWILLGGATLLVAGLFFGALVFGVILPDAFSLAILGIPFALVYGAGLWRGVIRMITRKRR
ncbi:MAG TPA: glycosyltransferase family 2 protein [Candidatus Saccharimonadales bacterium]|nr:glycosyltransferase family 2 protein [Candidatus Saccharimonadales bacterium]